MKRFLTILITIALTSLLLTGCSGRQDTDAVSADPAALAERLAGTVSGDTLSAVSDDILASVYFVDLDRIEEAAAYIGTGATACEAVVLKCADNDYPEEAAKLFETRVQNQSDLYASYNAAEVENLNNAIIQTSGTYALLCVTNDTDAADEILKEAGF